MGISGKEEELVDLEKAKKNQIPLIRRFSGGGTVIVDESTLFITFICQKELHNFPLFPEPVHRWAEELYKDVFDHAEFKLRENDYVIGEKKFGGNAQYLQKGRWLHHTSFLWDFNTQLMSHLLHPKKTPTYRAGRKHEEFLCRMQEFWTKPEILLNRLQNQLEKTYGLQEISLSEVHPILHLPHRQATTLIL